MKAYKSLAIFSIALFSLVLILSVFKSAPKELPEPIAIKEAIELDLTTTNLTVEAEEPRAKITIEKQTIIKISGFDKQQVGMIASQIKSIRPPEPYKGKGIKEKGQYILRKEGKKK